MLNPMLDAAVVALLVVLEVLGRLYLTRRRASAKRAVYCPFCQRARMESRPIASMWPQRGISVPEAPCEPCQRELRDSVVRAARSPLFADDAPPPRESGAYLNGSAAHHDGE